jgi:hypothetical protein
MRKAALAKIQEWFDAGEYRSAYSLAKNLARFDYNQSLTGFAQLDGKAQEWIDRIEAIGGHIPNYVAEFCRENGHTEAFEKDDRWWAFPPNGVMPVEVVNPEHLTAFGVTSRSQAMRLTQHYLSSMSSIQPAMPLVPRVTEFDRASGRRAGLGVETRVQIGLHFDGNPSELRDRLREEINQAVSRVAAVNSGFSDSNAPFSIAYLRGLREGWHRQLAKQAEDDRWGNDPLELMSYFPRLNLWAIGEGVRDFGAWLDSVGEWLQKLSDRLEK